jgi:hypothetical protein
MGRTPKYPPNPSDAELSLLAAINRARGKGLVRDDQFRFILAEMKKVDPSWTWRSLRMFGAAMRARSALNRMTAESPAEVLSVDKLPLTWQTGKKAKTEICATDQGLLIPWALVNKLKQQFKSGN